MATVNGYTYEPTQKLLSAAFDMVRNPEHWKNPVDGMVRWEHANVVMEAVVYFTGTPAECKRVRGPDGQDLAHITAPGYYAGPCN
jgi:hypothetical protein